MEHVRKLLFVLVSLVLSVTTTINAYGLTIVSWPWLVFGTIGALVLLVLAQAE